MNYIEYLEGGKDIYKHTPLKRVFSENWIPKEWDNAELLTVDYQKLKDYVRALKDNFKKNINSDNKIAPSYSAITASGDIIDVNGRIIGHFNKSDYTAESIGNTGDVYRPKSSI